MRTDPRVVAELRAMFLGGATPWRLVRHIASRHEGDPGWADAVGSYFAEAFGVTVLDPDHTDLDGELLRDMVGRVADWRTPGDPAWCDGLSVSPDELTMIDGLRPEAHPALAESWASLPPRVKDFVRRAMTNAQGYYEYAQVLARLAERLQQQVVELERRNQEVAARPRGERVRPETRVSLVACLFGAAVPLAVVGPHLVWGLPVVLVGVLAVPSAVVAATAWDVRRDRRASRVVAVVSVVNLVIGAVGWGWAASDPEGGAACVACLFVPWAQVMAWFCGALWSGLRRVR